MSATPSTSPILHLAEAEYTLVLFGEERIVFLGGGSKDRNHHDRIRPMGALLWVSSVAQLGKSSCAQNELHRSAQDNPRHPGENLLRPPIPQTLLRLKEYLT
ncbi:hypothetical protein U1Q18_000185 [Sarracenia purpurea var. burkii]